MDSQCNERNRFRNDLHSGMNVTRHGRVFVPESAESVAEVLQEARRAGKTVAIAGAQTAMGGQQFNSDGWLLDSRRLSGVLDFDREQGWVQVAAGTQWPQLQRFLAARFDAEGFGWSIRQKPAGIDAVSLGGALATNTHGNGMSGSPLVAEIENFNLVMADGFTLLVDRQREPELFSLAVGGFGLLGVVTDLTLRLRQRRVLKRHVQGVTSGDLAAAFRDAQQRGAEYGSCELAFDAKQPDFLQLGVLSSYTPCRDVTPRVAMSSLSTEDSWQAEQYREWLWLAHCNKSEAFRLLSQRHLASDGRLTCSDEHQFGLYLEGYHQDIDERLGYKGSDAMTELTVPLDRLSSFLTQLAATCRAQSIDLVQSTVTTIGQDAETTLAWAHADRACIRLNLHIRHDDQGFRQLQTQMQSLYDLALAEDGNFLLGYGLHARPDQLRQAYPAIDALIRAKHLYDPHALLQSNWYRRVCSTLGHRLEAPSFQHAFAG